MLSLVFVLATQTSPKVEIQRQYDAWSKAYMTRDVDTLIAILSPDYKLTTFEKKTLDYDVYAAKLRLMKGAPPDPTKYSTEIKSLALRGDEADVVSIETMESAGTDPKTSKPVIVLHRHEYLDTWIHYDAGWRLRRTITRKESTQYRPGQ